MQKSVNNLNDNPLVSVITAIYNAEEYIAETIKSVISQTFNNWEYIIVDNNSNDKSVEIIKTYLVDKRIKLYQEEKKGRCFARNKAFIYTSGKYIANLDADDFWHPKKLEKQVEIMERDDSIGLVYTGFNTIDKFGKILETHIPNDLGNNPLKFILTVKNPIVHSSTIIRRNAFVDNKYQDEDIQEADELVLYRKIFLKYNKAYLIKEPLVSYRIHSESGLQIISINEILSGYKKGLDIFFHQKKLPLHIKHLNRKAYGTMYYLSASIGIQQKKELGLCSLYLMKSAWLRPNKIYLCGYQSIRLLTNIFLK